MITDAQLRRLARELDVRLGYAEKNYVNSWWSERSCRRVSEGETILLNGSRDVSP